MLMDPSKKWHQIIAAARVSWSLPKSLLNSVKMRTGQGQRGRYNARASVVSWAAATNYFQLFKDKSR